MTKRRPSKSFIAQMTGHNVADGKRRRTKADWPDELEPASRLCEFCGEYSVNEEDWCENPDCAQENRGPQ